MLLVQFAVLYRGGEKVQMSTRSGEFVTLRQLRKEVGRDAARFFYVMRKCEQHLDFDLDLAKSQSADNPVYYVQYAHARICSVLRQAGEKGIAVEPSAGRRNLELLQAEHEEALLKLLARYPEVVEAAALNEEPHLLVHYLRDLANGLPHLLQRPPVPGGGRPAARRAHQADPRHPRGAAQRTQSARCLGARGDVGKGSCPGTTNTGPTRGHAVSGTLLRPGSWPGMLVGAAAVGSGMAEARAAAPPLAGGRGDAAATDIRRRGGHGDRRPVEPVAETPVVAPEVIRRGSSITRYCRRWRW